MIKVTVRYNDHLVDIHFPCSETTLQSALMEIHAADDNPPELFVTDVIFPEELNHLKDRFVNLDELNYRNKRLDTLSKGNQQKIQLITALAHDPDIVILDEPFSGLDPVNAMLLKDVVKEQISKGKIVLFSSHQMSYIEEFCDSIAILNNGVVALHGDLHDIKRDYPRNRLVVRTEIPDSIIADFGSSCTVMENGSLMLRLANPSEKKATMTRLVENYDIDEVKVFEPSLNDIFVEYAGDAAKED